MSRRVQLKTSDEDLGAAAQGAAGGATARKLPIRRTSSMLGNRGAWSRSADLPFRTRGTVSHHAPTTLALTLPATSFMCFAVLFAQVGGKPAEGADEVKRRWPLIHVRHGMVHHCSLFALTVAR